MMTYCVSGNGLSWIPVASLWHFLRSHLVHIWPFPLSYRKVTRILLHVNKMMLTNHRYSNRSNVTNLFINWIIDSFFLTTSNYSFSSRINWWFIISEQIAIMLRILHPQQTLGLNNLIYFCSECVHPWQHLWENPTKQLFLIEKTGE